VARDGGIEIPGGSNKGYNLGAIKVGGIKKGFRYFGESKDRVLYVSIVIVDNIMS
jgi:hypothetical protein